MVETDWRKILSFSQRELNDNDKEILCESLSWMEADDIELNFTDLKTLFKVAQDILKYKSEEVNTLLGKLEKIQRKNGKKKRKGSFEDSPSKGSDTAFETIAHQEEIIKANKDILEQLYNDIAELEGRKTKLEKGGTIDKDSDSSRGALSEINAVEELEHQLAMKNRHIRKLLTDVKILEDDNVQLKDKTSTLKEKLTEATQIIEKLTEQLFALNTECSQLKGLLGKVEESKAKLSLELEALHKELSDHHSERDSALEEIRSKVQHWRNIARAKKAENETLLEENSQLKKKLSSMEYAPELKVQDKQIQIRQLKELQEKLSEASNEITKSAKLIENLKIENKQLKKSCQEQEPHEVSISDVKNESDDGKERVLIIKLKKKINSLSVALQEAEETIASREKELAEVTSQLNLVQSGEEGLTALLEGLKSKKREIKLKDAGIKSLVQDVNDLNQSVDELQLENETMRTKLNIAPEAKISTKGILKKYKDIEKCAVQMRNDLRDMENKLITSEIDNRRKSSQLNKLIEFLHNNGYDVDTIEEIYADDGYGNDNNMPTDGGGEASTFINKLRAREETAETKQKKSEQNAEMQALAEENEGLRKGLQEILDFLKDNSTTTSGILALQCPSLEAVLQSLEARHSAGWLAPHMAVMMELKTALGGRDALLTALHDARKETYTVIRQLSQESKKSQELEQKLQEIEKNKSADVEEPSQDLSIFNNLEIGSWMSGKDLNEVDVNNKAEIENIVKEGNANYENQLKNSLAYFHNKFRELFNKMTALAIQSADEQNKWSIQEEKYKAQIENLKVHLHEKSEDDRSDASPGLIDFPSMTVLQRKCTYLEEAYIYARTSIENMKNEYLDVKKEAMIVAADYETKIQKLILFAAHLTDKLCNSISLDLFWKQNEVLNDITAKYNNLVSVNVKRHMNASDLKLLLEKDKVDIIEIIEKQRQHQHFSAKSTTYNHKQMLSNVEQTILQNQIERLCAELESTNNMLHQVENKNFELQENQSRIIDTTLATETKLEIKALKQQLEEVAHENKRLKDQCQHVGSQLDIALLQLQDTQNRQMSMDMEINMLRHQILDLQSASDNKAVIAKLSGDILVAHLQASEVHKKTERLSTALNKEIEKRIEAEEMLKTRENIFNIYSQRYESKFKYIYEVLQALRQQYQGCLPLGSVEHYLNNIQDHYRNSQVVYEKLNEIEDLRSNLMIKHSIYDQILELSKTKCLEKENNCPHKIKLVVTNGIHIRESDYYMKKIHGLEQSREELTKYCNHLEKTLVLVNQGFEKTPLDEIIDNKTSNPEATAINLELEDVPSDDESRKSQTITLPKPQLLKTPKNSIDMTNKCNNDNTYTLPGSPIKTLTQLGNNTETVNVFVQTSIYDDTKINKLIQTDADKELKDMHKRLNDLQSDFDKQCDQLSEVTASTQRKTEEIMRLNKEKMGCDKTVEKLSESVSQKDRIILKLQNSITDLNRKVQEYKNTLQEEKNKLKDAANEDNKSLLLALKTIEDDKNAIVEDYKQILNKERDEYLKTVRDLNVDLIELKSQLDRRDSNSSSTDAVKDVVNRYSMKIVELEDKCFMQQSELDGNKTEIETYKNEAERWKELASERLTKMEQLNSQLQERHYQEVESYKAENQHWLSQLNENQREHMDLRNKLAEQKAAYIKQLAEKDAQIDNQRTVINNLRAQIMNMQSMISVTDPSFDLSAIVEIEDSETSQRGSDRLEIRFDSSPELRDDAVGIPSSSTAIWQEPAVERLRREKQLVLKQNSLLRRQVKALAGRERRARLEAHNLKSQVYRISTSGSKAVTAETVSLQSKISSLQNQLSSARRDSHSSVALWDKWKRAQQSSDRWQARFEEKCRELKKLEASAHFTQSALTRLEREKRVLLNKLTHDKMEKQQVCEKQERESPEQPPPASLSAQTLLDRLEAQQRRIAALQLAEKGNEPLVSEYERSLAENTALKGQLLKLESALLESQMRIPQLKTTDDRQEFDYWKSYCDMLKEENSQLSMKLSALETTPHSAHQHRVNDLEQTILTLRGLVSKLQSEQKSPSHKMRPTSAVSIDNGRGHLESYRTEIANLKRSIMDKDNLLERSKEMLKIAAEREEELLRENSFLRLQIEELTQMRAKGGFLSA